MFTLFTLTLLCLAGVAAISVVGGLILTLIGLPLMLLFSLLPWLLRLAGVVLLAKALLDRPFQWESLLPALAVFAVAGLIRFLS